ncbi:hypothetical protein WN944_006899 [Citrus x changshan-huyou]|uniref:Uncharacterized protein n=1 Tax=Citrus x changshan-huyou TaxID=2935761 RepID=A0AAP0MM82_9ROSI
MLYFDIEAVIDGEVFSVGLAIPEQYSLHKLWVDIRDACWGHPIRNANGIKVQVIFPWQTEQQAILTDKDLLEAFEQLRVKGYNWARFAVTPKKVLPDINRVESSADKCTQQLNNDVESGNEELYNCYDASVDEFEDDYETDPHGSDLAPISKTNSQDLGNPSSQTQSSAHDNGSVCCSQRMNVQTEFLLE